jgi:TATA-box binding protein (TBP) (component of TFIID and TFIIIB)
MLIGRQGRMRLRIVALVLGSLAAGAMVIVGCTSVTQGTAQIDRADAPVYRASVSASIAESADSSSTRESERQASLTVQAVHTSCDALSSSSVDAITAVNNYVDAFNRNATDAAAKAPAAVDALNHSADLVARSLSDTLAPNLSDALNAWVDAARGLANAIAGNYGPDQFNGAITKLNDTKTSALNLCDAAYR